MRSFLCENLYSESFPNFDGKFIQGSDSWNKGDAGRPCDSEIELLTDPVIRNIFYPIRKPRRTFCGWCCFCRVRTQESFGQWLRDECARSYSRLKIAFRMKPRESDVYREPRYSQVSGQLTRGRQSGRVIVESCRNQFIANLAIKLFMKRFVRGAIEPNHIKGHDRMATPLFLTELFN